MFEVRSASLFAKLLSKSRVSLAIDATAPTAYVDMEKRVMYVPEWDVKDSTARMLIAHEMGHILHTPYEEWKKQIEKNSKTYPNFKDVMNVVEDARIEKLMQEMYPGLVRDFIQGYEELYDVKDFFHKKEPHDNRGLIDRVNCHFKLNVSGQRTENIPFNAAEQCVVDEIAKARSFEDVITATENLLKLVPPDEVPQIQMNFIFGQPEVKGNSIGKSSDGPTSLREAVTDGLIPQEVAEKIVEALSNMNSNVSRAISNAKKNGTFIIPTPEDFIKEITSRRGSNHLYTQLVAANTSEINFMYTEFMRKRDAHNRVTTRHRNSGYLDVKNLHKVKFNDNIFERKAIQGKQKNHGLILLLDGSGSMSNIFESAISQCYNLAAFAKKVNIPYEFYIFSSIDGVRVPSIYQDRKETWSLLEFYKNTDSIEMMQNKTSRAVNISLGSTPLCSSLIGMNKIIADFKTRNPMIDVVNFLVITDGQCDSSGLTYDYYSCGNSLVTTEKNPTGYDDSSAAFYKIFKDLYGVRVFSFDIKPNGTYNSIENTGGVDKHFTVPRDMLDVTNKIDSRVFLKEFMDAIS